MNLQEMVFRALLDYEAQGEIYIEKEKQQIEHLQDHHIVILN